jgi:uncharacterized protein YecE (DUF72 family)
MRNAGNIRIGIGGWVFPPWRGSFYPAGLPQSQELNYASRHLTAIEINGTFYNSGKADSFRKWRDETPDGFVFSLKGPRFVTHRNELGSAGDAAFLQLLPPEIGGRPLRHLVEVRHQSFRSPAFTELLQEHRVAVAMVDDAKFPAFEDVTADFAYLRLRRCVEEEPTGYSPEALDDWAERARSLAAEGGDVFLYFINGAKVRAPAAAQALIARLEQP